MTRDEARELLGAYALDAVDDDERRAVEELVAADPEAAAELAGLRATAAALGTATPSAPPDRVRDAVLASLATTPQEGRVVDLAQQRERREQRVRRPLPLAWAAAAAVAVVLAAGVPGTLAWQQHERAVAAEERADLLADVLADPGATLLRDAVAGGGEAVAVLTDERALLVAQDLPGLDDDRVYQVWAMRDGVPVAAGLLDLRDGGAARVLDDYRPGDGVALSVEPAGGSQQPTTTPVVVLLPQA
ncbi:anti-sigma factor domain-containing protein [Cellulomonas carbonis]|uniref:Regulator of SigK n=1 Tax=Cellulomonas carbonis T26 TaxID=947969 RepID=A0A0A0BSR1_9CELL|nr:anti-sigma factor [Cellulomonas carbonis]KGM11483.1 anti-sigma factor [Cellulomonas carbonis T26]GGC04158.1 hypothetical protein GCM10010972_16650 [Cellulomonas carbonis]